MTPTNIEQLAAKVCVGEFSTLHIDFNEFKSGYQTAAQAIQENFNGWFDDDSFVSPEEKQRCIDTNTIWGIQWYPHTPVGFHKVLASTLEAAVAAVLREAEQ